MPIYCGNNLNDPKLTNGTHNIGTKYQCLRKGIGVGINLPYDPAYSIPYRPIDPRKFYCGKSRRLPDGGGHFAVGSPSKCLQKGVGIGKKQTADRRDGNFRFSFNTINSIGFNPYIIFIVIVSIVSGLLYFIKPKIITKPDPNYPNKNIIDGSKFIVLISIISIITVIVLKKIQ
jgi:hypothetical protein